MGMGSGQPTQAGHPQMGIGVVRTDLSPAELEKLGISLIDWARLPGKLRDEILQAAADESPDEYRALIKKYFQELARRSGAESGAAPGGESDDARRRRRSRQ